jgi:DNA-binding response OmpR family regulator
VGCILVVDDDAVVRELLRMNFELEGHDVLEAVDGASALVVVRDERPDAVLLDVMMPAPNGFEVCAMLRDDPLTAAIPVILLTARALSVDRVRGHDAGADAYVTKPFDPLELVELVEGLVARSRT